MTVIPNRTYTFSKQSGFVMQTVDTYPDNFEPSTSLQVFSQVEPVDGSAWFGCFDRTVEQKDHTGEVISHRESSRLLDAVAGAVAGPSILAVTGSVENHDQSWKRLPNGDFQDTSGADSTGQIPAAIDVSRGVVIPNDYVAVMYGPPPTTPTVPPAQSVTVTLAGDFRRPKLAGPTRALSDDELWAVQQLAHQVSLPGPQMFAILVELTGARQSAYHPDGFYGISNLTAGQIVEGTPGGSPPPPGTSPAQQFLASSVRQQLDVTRNYMFLHHVGALTGVFRSLATGTSGGPFGHFPPGPIPVVNGPLPARLLPFSDNGSTITADDVIRRITARTLLVQDEFQQRLPANVTVMH